MSDTVWTYLLLAVTAFVAGIINAIAGGGTLLTFPALSRVVSLVVANATSTVALVPASFAAAWGYRRDLKPVRNWAVLLAAPSLIGGLVGSLLLTRIKESYFALIVPWLILVAALLFLLQPLLARFRRTRPALERPSPLRLTALIAFQFVVAVYGGYFGAGIGILMLSALALMGLTGIHGMNAIKCLMAALINGISVVVFVAEGKVDWSLALVMAAASILGGYAGARVALLLRPGLVRGLVTAIGFAMAAYFFWQQYTHPANEPQPGTTHEIAARGRPVDSGR